MSFRAHFAIMRVIGSMVGTGISACFLFIIALINLIILGSVWRAFRAPGNEDLALPGGPLSRILRPLMAVISDPRQMYPVGFLFGLGFDTASEVGLLGVSASEASRALPLWAIMVFPALFTAGMTLIDTTDGLLMKNAYSWALIKPKRRLAYNFIITLLSVLVALIIGGLEALNLIAGRFALTGDFWRWVGDLNAHFGMIGFTVAAVLVGCWMLSSFLSRSKPAAAIDS